MARRNRAFSPFSLAFLDVMSCGFGAAVLLFLVIRHQADEPYAAEGPDLAAEVALLEADIDAERRAIADLTLALAQAERERGDLAGEAARLRDELAASSKDARTLANADRERRIAALKARLKALSEEKEKRMTELEGEGSAVRRFIGDGRREYITGLRIGGRRVLILFDTSASMLDDSIVNIIRTRNMAPQQQRRSEKWQRAIATLDWLTARLPPEADVQVYFFAEDARPALGEGRGAWLPVGDGSDLDRVVAKARDLLPTGGTSLAEAFAVVKSLSPRPDNVYLITDGLPTRGTGSPRGTTVSGKRRMALFERAARVLPKGVPINVILFPLEGDPMAAPAFWQLAQASSGGFLSPARDWP